MKNEKKNNNAICEYLTIADVGAYLNVSLSQAYGLAHRKDFPVSRFGGSIRVPRQAFMVWVDKHTRIPAALVG